MNDKTDILAIEIHNLVSQVYMLLMEETPEGKYKKDIVEAIIRVNVEHAITEAQEDIEERNETENK